MSRTGKVHSVLVVACILSVGVCYWLLPQREAVAVTPAQAWEAIQGAEMDKLVAESARDSFVNTYEMIEPDWNDVNERYCEFSDDHVPTYVEDHDWSDIWMDAAIKKTLADACTSTATIMYNRGVEDLGDEATKPEGSAHYWYDYGNYDIAKSLADDASEEFVGDGENKGADEFWEDGEEACNDGNQSWSAKTSTLDCEMLLGCDPTNMPTYVCGFGDPTCAGVY